MYDILKLSVLISIILLSGSLAFAADVQNEKTGAMDSAGIISQYSDNILGNYTEKNSLRQKTSLNGVWKIALCDKPEAPLPDKESDFGYTVVPSSWMSPADFPIFGNEKFKPRTWNGDSTFAGKLLKNYPCSWYVKEFKTPPDLNGKDVFLMIDNAIISADIFLNGKNIGRQTEREDVKWKVNDVLRAEGEANSLSVRVTALLDEQVKFYLGGDQTVINKISATLGGITGDVWLISEPPPSRIADVFVKTSVRNRDISFDVSIEKIPGLKQDAIISAEIFENDGKIPLLSFTKELSLEGEQDIQSFNFGGKWKNPILWDLDNPHLYRLIVSLSSNGVKTDEYLPVTFGFREAWIDGKNIILNGKPLHLFAQHMAGHDAFVSAASKNAERKINTFRQVGYNTIMLGSEGTFKKGTSAQYYDDIFKYADREGIPVILPIAPAYSINWNDTVAKDKWKNETGRLIRKYRNHPSLLMYSLNFNYLGYPWDLNPNTWDCKYYPSDKLLDLGRKRKESAETEEFVRSIDPTQIIYHHASGNYGSMLTSNFYIAWPPLQEREDYPSKWADKGSKPFFAVEFACPSEMDYFRARNGNYETVRYSEMLEAEYACQHIGPKAFEVQSNDYLDILCKGAMPAGEMQAGADKYDIYQTFTWKYNLYMHEPVISHIMAIYPQYLRSWRTYGVSGMSPNSDWLEPERLEPWHGKAVDFKYNDFTLPGPKPFISHIPPECDTPTKLGQEIGKALKPVMIYVGGGEKEGFSAKDHAYFANEKIKKQLVVVNSSRKDLSIKIKWSLKDAATQAVIIEETENIDAPVGESTFSRIIFSAPDVNEKKEFVISLSTPDLKDNDLDISDFRIQVFPHSQTKITGIKAAVLDPEGSLDVILNRLKIPYDKIGKNTNLGDYGIIIAGRNALSDKSNPLLGKIMESVCKNGKTLLCFEQKDLGIFNLRTHPRGVRKAFVLQAGHPTLEGIENKDMENWRGDYSLLEAYPQPRSSEDIYPEEPWKWGNSGSICSYMIEKPHTGPFKSILECEFDLNYSPLAEITEGNGRVILSQLDITGRFETDPVAAKLAENLIRYGSGNIQKPKSSVASYSETGLMNTLGIAKSDKKPDIIICDDEKALTQERKQEIVKLVEAGGTAFLIGQGLMKDLSWLPAPVKTKNSLYYRAIPETASDIGSGLSISDLFLKDRRSDILPMETDGLISLSKPPLISEISFGKGKVVLFAIHPFEYKISKVSPERNTRNYQKMCRSICILLSNRGVEFKPLSEKFLSGRLANDISLPSTWKFRIDPENKGMRTGWMDTVFNDSKWMDIKVPGYWENQGVTDANPNFPESKNPYDGYAWYRCKIVIPEYCKGEKLYLLLGAVDDMDFTYFNGTEIGSIGTETKDYYCAVRDYRIPEKTIRFGKENTIAVKVFDNFGFGGIVGPELKIHTLTEDNYPYLNDKPLFNPYKLTRW